MKLKIRGKDQEFHFDLDIDSVTIGRSSDSDFVIPLEDFSRKHCQITFKGEYAFIMDLGSKNGVIIDGKRIPAHQQFPIYNTTRVLLANHFEFILPDGTSIKEVDLSIAEPIRRLR